MPKLSDTLFIGILIFVCLLTANFYWPGLNGPFLLDDFSSLELAKRFYPDLISVALSRADQAGLPGRPLSMLSFFLSAEDYPFDAWQFKYVNLCLHIATGLAWAWLAFLICTNSKISFLTNNAKWIALLSATIWLLHPLNVSTVLYVVQRMTILAAFFVILGLISFVYGIILIKESRILSLFLLWIAYPSLIILGVLSKENAVLCIPLTILIYYFIFKPNNINAPNAFLHWSKQNIWFIFVVILPFFFILAKLFISFPSHLDSYETREFSIEERLLTQPRVLALSLYNLLIPTSTSASVFYDNIETSRSLLSPPTTAIAIFFIYALMLSSILLRKHLPIFSLSILWFFISHFLESTYIPLEMYFEHRNYLPSMGIIFLLSCSLIYASRFFGRPGSAAIILLYIFITIFSLHNNIGVWKNPDSLALFSHLQHPESTRATEFYINRLVIHGKINEAGRIITEAEATNTNNSYLILLKLFHECLYPGTTDTQISNIDHITQNLSKSNLNFGAVGLAQQLADSVASEKCKYLSDDDMHKIIKTLLGNTSFKKSAISMHNLYIAEAKLHAAKRNFAKTMLSVQNAIESKAMFQTYFLAANILLSANRSDLALDFLRTALEKVNNRAWPLNSLYKVEIEQQIEEIESSMVSQRIQ